MDNVTKWLPALITVLLTVVGALAEPIKLFVASHPLASIILGGVYALLKLFITSPIAKPDVEL